MENSYSIQKDGADDKYACLHCLLTAGLIDTGAVLELPLKGLYGDAKGLGSRDFVIIGLLQA